MTKEVKLRKVTLVAFVFFVLFLSCARKRERRFIKEAISTITTRSVIRFWDVDCGIPFLLLLERAK